MGWERGAGAVKACGVGLFMSFLLGLLPGERVMGIRQVPGPWGKLREFSVTIRRLERKKTKKLRRASLYVVGGPGENVINREGEKKQKKRGT